MKPLEFKKHFKNIESFLLQCSYRRSVNVRKNSTWAKDINLLRSFNIPIHPLHGKCFVTASFCYYFAGGQQKGWTLKCIKKQFVYITLPNGEDLKTTHWFIENSDGTIFDPSKSQFSFGYTPDNHYVNGIKAAIGWPYFRWKGKKSKRYHENVPSQEVLRLAEDYRTKYGSAGHLDKWLKTSNKFRKGVLDGQY